MTGEVTTVGLVLGWGVLKAELFYLKYLFVHVELDLGILFQGPSLEFADKR